MSEKKRFFVLIDFSEYSESVLQLVNIWLEREDFEVRVLHQLDFQLPTLANHEIRLKMIYDHKREVLNSWYNLEAKIFGKSNCNTFEIVEEPLIKYLERYKENSCYIMMGLKGTGLFKKIFIGSMVSQVLESLNHTVIAVPKKYTSFHFSKLVVTAHPDFDLNLSSLRELITTLPSSVQSVQWVSIAREGDNAEDLYDFLQAISKKMTCNLEIETAVFSGNDVFDKVKTHLSSGEDQFLVIQKGGRTFSDKLFRKFLVNDLVHDGSIPLIILPN